MVKIQNPDDRKYLGLAMPAAMEGIGLAALSSADIIMVGALGAEAIAAVSIFTQPRMMLLCVTRSIASALTLLTAHRYGQGCSHTAGAVLMRTLFLSLLVLGAGHLGFYWQLAAILSWMGAESSWLGLALTYGNLALIGVFLTSLAAVLQAVLLGFGRTKVVMWANIQGNIVNVIGNALFIFGLGPFPALGVQGAAIGTVIGTAWTLGVTVAALRGQVQLPWRQFWPDRTYWLEFLPTFASVFSEQGFERIGMVLYTRMVAELGTIPYAVHAVCMNFCDFYYSFAGGLGKASMILSGHMHGRQDCRQWTRYMWTGMKWGLLSALGACLLTWGLRDEILRIYSGDEAIIAAGGTVMVLVALASFPEAQSLIGAGILRGCGCAAQVAVCSFTSIAFLRPLVTAFFLYQLGLGVVGAWLALLLDQTIRASWMSWLLWKRRSGR